MKECASPASSPDLNPNNNFRISLIGHLQAESKSSTLVPDFTNAPVAEWKQIPLVEAVQEDCSKLDRSALLFVDTNKQIFSTQLQL